MPFLGRLARFHEAGDQAEELARPGGVARQQDLAVAIDAARSPRRAPASGCSSGSSRRPGSAAASSRRRLPRCEIGASAVAQLAQKRTSNAVMPGTRRSRDSGRRDRRRRRRWSRSRPVAAICSATQHAPAAEMPAKMPSSRASRRVISSASAWLTQDQLVDRLRVVDLRQVLLAATCGCRGCASLRSAARRRCGPPGSSPSGSATRR